MYILTCFKRNIIMLRSAEKILLHFMLSDIDFKITIRIVSITFMVASVHFKAPCGNDW